ADAVAGAHLLGAEDRLTRARVGDADRAARALDLGARQTVTARGGDREADGAERHHERDDQGGDRAHQKSRSSPPVSVTWVVVLGWPVGSVALADGFRVIVPATAVLSEPEIWEPNVTVIAAPLWLMVALKSESVATKSPPSLRSAGEATRLSRVVPAAL